MKKVKYLISALFISLSITGLSQNSAESDSMLIKNEKFYINKHLPLYLWISSSGDGSAEQIKLEGSQNNKYANPFYLDTEGHNTVYPNYAVSLKQKNKKYYINRLVFDVYADGLPSKTYLKYYNVRYGYRNGKRYYKTGLKVKLKSYDGMSGVKTTYYKINESEFKPYTDKILFDTAGEYKLSYYSVDYTGNEEEVNHLKLTVSN
ncbi:MAG: hypothetical protein U9N85_12610 [Bacteroidota bacterium]|nr:hypothetical protein [Bacteroidota bacterium]